MLYDDEEREDEEKEEQVDETQKKLQELTQAQRQLLELLKLQQTSTAQPQQPVQPQAPAQPQPTVMPEVDFEKLAELINENPQEFLKQYTDALTRAVARAVEVSVRPVSAYIQALQAQEQQRRIHEAFYSRYPELRGYEDIVGLIAHQVVSENPTWSSYDEYFEEIAKRTKKRLKELGISMQRQTTMRATPAGLPAQQGVAVSSDITTSAEDVVLETLNRAFLDELKKAAREGRERPPSVPSRRRG
ncbi:MAG: hypothetical protein QXI60_09905 [Thermofilaceae archaeon]